ncbi:type I 3-dehydroquinate dehydratase [Tetragenococcus solitarius]|uniref:3-dehydroquinate dehydratase n=1 Tax=Tetragenococcus solitarius TaxID=71453 RepID=A0ABP6KQ96_9ENTE|nr:type I 3-dehydroquinate dehydratase [Tetragenococcus solitarius]
MSVVEINDLKLGSGRPKIAVPLTGKTQDELLKQADDITTENADLVEWRIDHFANVRDSQLVNETSKKLYNKLADLPLLITFRTADEGGALQLKNEEEYFLICKNVVENQCSDLLDLELFRDARKRQEMIKLAQKNDIKIIMSNHNFEKTPEKEKIFNRLQMMQNFGADIAKIAVMPNSVEDILSLLDVTHQAKQKLQIPIITMAMGDLGKLSRISGDIFGSCLTFGTVGKASAPGQIESEQLRSILDVLRVS